MPRPGENFQDIIFSRFKFRYNGKNAASLRSDVLECLLCFADPLSPIFAMMKSLSAVRHPRLSVCLLLGLVFFFGPIVSDAKAAKNVVIMVADGAGYNIWLSASMYQGKIDKQIYDQPDWNRFSVTTFPQTRSYDATMTDRQSPDPIYRPQKAWDESPVSNALGRFAGYVYLKSTPTDSAAAATAMSTGEKTYNHAINWSNFDEPMEGRTIAEIAKASGRSAGVVTSVPWSHATPAGLGGAHDPYRYGYVKIAREMLFSRTLDVIMGGGNPDFNDDGQPVPPSAKKIYRYVGGQSEWEKLKSGTHPGGWTLVETKADFEKLVSGPTPKRVVGTAQVDETLQFKRRIADRNALKTERKRKTSPEERKLIDSGEFASKPNPAAAYAIAPEPYSAPKIENVPDLATMALGALNCLDENPKGFFLMIEGGAVDWANHENYPERMIEEMSDYLKTVQAVAAWIEKNGGWENNLLILTADHDTGLIWGEHSTRIAYEPLKDNGPEKIPCMDYNTTDHSNSLVPLHARGAGADSFKEHVRGNDPKAAEVWHVSGDYIDNTDIFKVMKKSLLEEKK